ncbi:MAG: hypothetical protein R3A47_01205 [Polyangiales bacterium]
MTESIIVRTHFEDIASFAKGFVDRVMDDDNIILYGPNEVAEGTEVEFSVQLVDGQPALTGGGTVRVSIDGGDDREDETRFDVVLNQLALSERDQIVFERILLAREPDSIPPQAPASDDTLDDADEITFDATDEDFVSFVESETLTGEEIRGSESVRPSPTTRSLDDGARGLYRPARIAVANAASSSDSDRPRPAGEKFQYGFTLPIPSRPPHPGTTQKAVEIDEFTVEDGDFTDESDDLLENEVEFEQDDE